MPRLVFALVLRRLALAPLLLVALAAVSFALVRAAPGGPFDGERKVDPAVEDALKARFHLDRSGPMQFLIWTQQAITGDLGPSMRQPGRTVNEIILARLPVSLWLGGLALLVAVCLGVGIGILGAVRAGTLIDHSSELAAAVLVALPMFVIGPGLVAALAMGLGMLPVAGWSGYLAPAHLVLPVLTLALPFAARIARLTRAGLVESLHLDHVRTATAKGASASAVIVHHALPVALLPTISFLGPTAAGLLTGSLVVEKIFQIPGLGREFIESALNRDYTLVLGTTVVYGGIVILANLCADLLFALVDPRVRGRT